MSNPPPQERPTAGELSNLSFGGDGLKCDKCGCRHLPRYGGSDGKSRKFRYRVCRNCGAAFLTSEQIVRDVDRHEKGEGD